MQWLQEVLTGGLFAVAALAIAVEVEVEDFLDDVLKLHPPMPLNIHLSPAINAVRQGILLLAAPQIIAAPVTSQVPAPADTHTPASVHALHPQLAGMPQPPTRGTPPVVLVPAATLGHPLATPWCAWLAQSILNRP